MTHTSHVYTVIKLPDQRDAFDWAVTRDGYVLTCDLPSMSIARYQSERDAQAHANNLTRLERKAVEDRLIAAAPALLEALKELLALADETRTSAFDAGVVSDLPVAFGRNDYADKARAAIALATGEKSQ